MSLSDTRQNNKKFRRRKKRRTADISDSEPSSSAEDEIINDTINSKKNIVETKPEMELSDTEEVEKINDNIVETLDDETQEKLSKIPFTRIERTNRISGDMNITKAQDTIQKDNDKVLELLNDQKQLKNDYLGYLFENYGDDINKLRESPDFTTQSLGLIANVLKEGSNKFELDTLKTILE